MKCRESKEVALATAWMGLGGRDVAPRKQHELQHEYIVSRDTGHKPAQGSGPRCVRVCARDEGTRARAHHLVLAVEGTWRRGETFFVPQCFSVFMVKHEQPA